MDFPIQFWSSTTENSIVSNFLKRPAFDPKAEAVASELLAKIREGGDKAVLEAVRLIDGVELTKDSMRISEAELAKAREAVPEAVKRNVIESYNRVATFAKNGMRPDWYMDTPNGGRLGERFLPLDRVGVYIPGGTAPLASTAIMTATLAKVAGVKEIVGVTPCTKDGSVNPVLLFALEVAGATEIYRIGGIQAIGMLAYGTESVRAVRKIVGPGGAFVTAAKRQVYGNVALDLVAGPSEICVVADSTARADWLAADLLSQIEHGTGHEKALLVTDNAELAKKTGEEVVRQLALLPRASRMEKALTSGGLMLAVTPNIDEACALANAFAPEHLEVIVKDAAKYAEKLTTAGAIFVGPWTPESAGDFAAGPSHVLPTGGAAAKFSGLTVEDFRRRTSIIEYTKEDLEAALPVIKTFGEIEGLLAHTRQATIRMEE